MNPNQHSFSAVVRIIALVFKYVHTLLNHARSSSRAQLITKKQSSIMITDEEIKTAEMYYFKKASQEIIQFLPKREYKNITRTNDDGIQCTLANHSGIENTLRYVLKKAFIIEGRILIKSIKFLAIFSILQWEALSSSIANQINNLPLVTGNIVGDFECLDLITPNRLLLGRNNDRCPSDIMNCTNPTKQSSILCLKFGSWCMFRY